MILKLLAVFMCFSGSTAEWKPTWLTPEQIHLSFGAKLNEMVVTWITMNKTGPSEVWYGKGALTTQVFGTVFDYTDQGKLKWKRYVHQAKLSGLDYKTTYLYRVGSNDSWSPVLRLKTVPNSDEWQPNILVFGDLGNNNDRTVAMMTNEIQAENPNLDFAIHLGDFAYNLEHSNGQVGDAFFHDIEGMASYKPYQVLPGNHEDAVNFTDYNSRFAMYSEGSAEKNNFFYSYNFGLAHFVFFNTEFHYTPWYGTHQIMNQYRWLEDDLKKANADREKHPWIITLGHRPLYDNWYINNRLRVGNKTAPGFEHLFWKYGVDLQFYAHDHIYARSLPIYNKKVMKGNVSDYTNPGAPVHIISGSAGCAMIPDKLNTVAPFYSAFASRQYGYSRLKILSKRELRLVTIGLISPNQNAVIDDFTLVKDKHGPY